MALIGVLGLDAGIEMGVDAVVCRCQELEGKPAAASAVGTGILVGHRQCGIVAPSLDKAHCLGEGGIGFEDLGEPSPEDHDIAILPDALGNGKTVEEIGWQDMGKLHRVGGDGRVREIAAFGGENVLQATLNFATNLRRESGEEWLFVGHTRINLITGFRASPNSANLP